MLIGARCRDVLHRQFRNDVAGRVTRDIDFAVALPRWDDFWELKRHFGTVPGAWQRIEVNSIPIDLVPFGPLENPPGEIANGDGPIGKYKDATDLALVLAWAEGSDAFWDNCDRTKYLGETDAMAAEHIGLAVGAELGEKETTELLLRFGNESEVALEIFASELRAPREHVHALSRRRVQVEALLSGLRDSIGGRELSGIRAQ